MSRRLALIVAAVVLLFTPFTASDARVPTSATARAGIPIIVAVAHPDDDALGPPVSIAEALAAGRDVHVLWLTRGAGSGVLNKLNGTGTATWWGVPHDPVTEGYSTLTTAQFGEARIAEGTNAMRLLLVGYPGTLTLHEAGLTDGSVTQSLAEAAILNLADFLAPGGDADLWGHTYLTQLDLHPDHIAAGAAIHALKLADPGRFTARHYILPYAWADPDLNLVVEVVDLPSNAGVTARVINATRAYGAFSPPLTYAVGWQSTPTYFTSMQATPKSVYHP